MSVQIKYQTKITGSSPDRCELLEAVQAGKEVVYLIVTHLLKLWKPGKFLEQAMLSDVFDDCDIAHCHSAHVSVSLYIFYQSHKQR